MSDIGAPEHHDSAPDAGADPGVVHKVFISYASQDVSAANVICAALESAGLPCWIAPRDVRGGESYAAAIVQAINGCRTLVLILSKSAIESPHVLREVERASSKQRPVVSIRMDNSTPSPDLEYFLSANHWLDASTGSVEAIIPALVESIRARDAAGATSATLATHRLESSGARGQGSSRVPSRHSRMGRALPIVTTLAVLGIAYLAAERFWLAKRAPQPATPVAAVSGTPAAPPTTADSGISDKSIAVLPFTDMSEKKDQEYFSDGLSEELIDLLVKVPGLHVPARTSSFYFKGKSEDIPTIAKRLMVAHVLEGSVRKSGNNLRITAQLIRADTGFHMWSETYDRQLNDVFKVQDEIAGAVVEKLKVALLTAPAAASATQNAQAYNLFLQARYLAAQDDNDGLLRATDLYGQAIAIDPKYALAYAWLAECYTRRVANGVDTNGTAYMKARAAAEKSIELDPQLPDGYLFLAIVKVQHDLDWDGALALLHKARKLDPNNLTIVQFEGHLTQTTGTLAQAEEVFRNGIEKDPLNMLLRRYLGRTLYFENKLPEAEATLRKLIELNPRFPAARYELVRVLIARGDFEGALAQSEAEPSPAWKMYTFPLVYWAMHRPADARKALDVLLKDSDGSEFQVAETYAYFGDRDQAFHWLDEAVTRHDPGLVWIRRDPLLRSIASDPRYKAFLTKIKLNE